MSASSVNNQPYIPPALLNSPRARSTASPYPRPSSIRRLKARRRGKSLQLSLQRRRQQSPVILQADTQCPEDYERSERTGRCIRLCAPNKRRSIQTHRCVKVSEDIQNNTPRTFRVNQAGDAVTGSTLASRRRKACGPGRERSPFTGRCINNCFVDEERDEITGRCELRRIRANYTPRRSVARRVKQANRADVNRNLRDQGLPSQRLRGTMTEGEFQTLLQDFDAGIYDMDFGIERQPRRPRYVGNQNDRTVPLLRQLQALTPEERDDFIRQAMGSQGGRGLSAGMISPRRRGGSGGQNSMIGNLQDAMSNASSSQLGSLALNPFSTGSGRGGGMPRARGVRRSRANPTSQDNNLNAFLNAASGANNLNTFALNPTTSPSRAGRPRANSLMATPQPVANNGDEVDDLLSLLLDPGFLS